MQTEKPERTDIPYWDAFYIGDLAHKPPSDFAKFAADYMLPHKMLIDIGCGNGRDSMYFCNMGLKVTAIDSSMEAINSFDKSMPVFAVCDDFVKTKALLCIDYDYCYARWSIHAIPQSGQDELLPNIFRSIKNGGLLFVESRTVNDVKYGEGEPLGLHEYICDNHYRRFLDPNAFILQLEAIGFEIVYYEESDTFSIIGNDAPMLMRVIAKKPD